MFNLIYILFFWLIIQIILTIIWYYKPEKFLSLKYDIVSPLKMEDITEPVLFLTTHEEGHKDCSIMCGECRKANNKINILAKHFYFSIQNIPLFTSYNKILVKDKENNLTKKCIELIKNKQSIMMMLHRDNKKKGLYYILKETKIPIVFCRMKQNNHFLYENKEKNQYNVTLEYEMYKNYDLTLDKEKFIYTITQKLYS